MPKIRIYPYKAGSRSAKALAEALGGLVLKREGSAYRPRRGDLVINWGSTTAPQFHPGEIVNIPLSIRIATNKLTAFEALINTEVRIPDFWTRKEDIPEDAFPIVCRTILSGHSGAGIHLANTRAELVNAPLYVRYIKKQDEYRIHIVRGETIIKQRKARDPVNEDPNWQIRNHDNGFIFVRNDVNPPEDVIVQAKLAIEALGLDFGAVDVVYNNHRQEATVLEVNTAPGLEGQTITDYAEAFRRLM